MANQWQRNRGMQIAFYRPEDSTQPSTMGTYDDEPGVYYLPNGKLATDEQARQAGFDVKADRERGAAVQELAEAQTKLEAVKIKAASTAKRKKYQDDEPEVVFDADLRESPNYRMKHIGAGRWDVLFKTDDSLAATGISKDEALKILHEDIADV